MSFMFLVGILWDQMLVFLGGFLDQMFLTFLGGVWFLVCQSSV